MFLRNDELLWTAQIFLGSEYDPFADDPQDPFAIIEGLALPAAGTRYRRGVVGSELTLSFGDTVHPEEVGAIGRRLIVDALATVGACDSQISTDPAIR